MDITDEASSWQERSIRLASHVMTGIANANEAQADMHFDNVSRQCPGWEDGYCLPCPDSGNQSLSWLVVLQWIKVAFLKAARSYQAKPFLLVMAPLCVGLALGYAFGGGFNQTKRHSQWKRSKGNSVAMRWIEQLLARILSVSYSCLGGASSPSKTIINETNAPSFSTQQQGSSPQSSMMPEKEESVRTDLRSDRDTYRESDVDVDKVPQHVAVIMDGNRRYGKAKYGNISKGHWDGSSKLVEFAKWCIAEQVAVLTVYAFSTENWNRKPSEVAALMDIFATYCDELRLEALRRNIKILVLSTDGSKIPRHVQLGLDRMTEETSHCSGLTMNICMSYGSRGELVSACKQIASDVQEGVLDASDVDEEVLEGKLLTRHCGDPDVLIRTSGEVRISNFLLWQLAYSEMFFIEKPWPAVEKSDLLHVIRTYADGRNRRFGK